MLLGSVSKPWDDYLKKLNVVNKILEMLDNTKQQQSAFSVL